MSILIVDDNELVRMLIQAALAQWNYKAVAVGSGNDALRCLETCSDIELVITDVVMPDMNGLELCRRLKASPLWQNIPVILCTALADTETVMQSAQMGCRYYIVKPIQLEPLRQKVVQALENSVLPVLRKKEDIQLLYRLQPQVYDTLAKALLSALRHNLSLLDKPEDDAVAALSLVDLAKLAEGASVLGAERLVQRVYYLQEVLKQGPPKPEHSRMLKSELELLAAALEDHFKLVQIPKGSAPTNAAATPPGGGQITPSAPPVTPQAV